MAGQGVDTSGAGQSVSRERRTIVIAVVSLVAGAVSLRIFRDFLPLPVIGILLAMASLSGAGRTTRSVRLAGAGLVLSMVGLLMPIVKTTCGQVDVAMCHSQEMRLGLALIQYADDWDDRLPDPRQDWVASTEPYVRDPSVMLCPADKALPSYQLEPSLRGASTLKEAGPLAILLFETDDGMNLVRRHEDGAVYAYVDGHTKWLSRADTPERYRR